VRRYLLNIPKKVLNLELSSGAFSATAADGVTALELSLELSAEAVLEPVWAFSGARSAMIRYVLYSRPDEEEIRAQSCIGERSMSSGVEAGEAVHFSSHLA
jgi:hypothetical protein